MSPSLHHQEHDKILIWPDEIENPDLYINLPDIFDNLGQAHEVLLYDEAGITSVYSRVRGTGIISANFVLEFDLIPPEGFPQRVPQITSAFVSDDFRGLKIAQMVYRLLMAHYGAIMSDSVQTQGGILIWLLMAQDDQILLNIMETAGNRLRCRVKNGMAEEYCGEPDALEAAAPTIWGGASEAHELFDPEVLGFKPAYRAFDNIILTARPV